MIKNCAWCGKEFSPNRWNQKYCCPECRAEATRHRQRMKYWATHKPAYRKCKCCGETFRVSRTHTAFCSVECRLDYYSKSYRVSDPEAWKRYAKKYNGNITASNNNPDYVPYHCYKRGQRSCFTCTIPPEECHG